MANEPRSTDYAVNNVTSGNAAPVVLNGSEKAAVAGVVAHDEALGAPVHVFNPNATPAQKGATAGKAKGDLAPVNGSKGMFGGMAKSVLSAPKGVLGVGSAGAKGLVNIGTSGATGLVHAGAAGATGLVNVGTAGASGLIDVGSGVVNVGTGIGKGVLSVAGLGEKEVKHVDSKGRALAFDTSTVGSPEPTVTLKDLEKPEDVMPGGVRSVIPPVPTWLLSGWKEVAGIEGRGALDAKTQQQVTLLTYYLSENMYGAWYHNAGIIVFAVVATRFITVVRLGWGWVLLILACCASYYTLSIARTRHRARDDIQRELVKTRLVTETESADWLNGFLDRFWLIYEPVLSQTIVASVDAALAANTPSFLESIRLTTFTLGTKAPRIDFVRTFPKTPDDIVIMDWAISFTPNDMEDTTPRQAAKQVNPKIVLAIRLGKAGISTGLPILLEDMSFTGKMRIKLKLMSNMPHIQRVEMSFIEKPTFDYVLKPLGGETFGFDINNIPGLAPFIRDQVHSNLGPMMYDPNVFTIDLEALLSGTPLDAAIGVLKITVLDARGLKAVKLGGGAPDPYVAIALGAKPAVAQTKTIESNANPSWHETQFVLVNSLADVLNFNLFDYNDHRPDSLLGSVSHELNTLTNDAEQEGIVGKILGGGKERGELRYDLSYFPVLQPSKNPDGTMEPPPETQTGIVRLTIHQAKDLDITRANGDLNPFARVFLGNGRKPVHTTKTLKHANTPIWEEATEFLVADRHASVVTIDITDKKDFAVDPVLGKLSIRLSDLLDAKTSNKDWFPLQKSRAGRIRLTADWKPVAMTGSIDGAASYVPPIGILRIWLKKAVDVKNVEAALGGKSDPYVRVMTNNKTLARTEVMNNNLNPEWDQIIYVPVHSLRERVILEVMDYQNVGKDRSLGSVGLSVSDCAETSDDPKYPYKSKGHQVRVEKIQLDKANTFKGQLMFEVDFKPGVSLRGGVSFDAKKNELEVAAEQATAAGAVRNGAATTDPAVAANGDKPNAPQGEEPSEVAKPEAGVELSTSDLLASQSGILVFQVISGQLARRGALEVMFDDGYWPSYVSEKARSSHPTWDQVGEGFVRELDFGRTWLRINAADDSDREDIVAEVKMDTKEFLEQALNKKADFLLSMADGSNRSIVTMSARFVPVDIKLEPRESINNMGVLRVDVIGAKGLMAADRSGKSDPNVAFNNNGMKVFKSETKKKTLSPIWNESFEVLIPSRVAAKFQFEVSDWNQVGTSTPLGSGLVDLTALEPFESQEVSLPVMFEGKEKGSLQLKLLFQPEIIARSRQKTSTFSSAGRAITQIGGAPVAVGKGVVHSGGAVVMGVGHGVGTIGGFAGRAIGLKRKDKSSKDIHDEAPPSEIPVVVAPDGYQVPAGQVSAPAGAVEEGVPGMTATTLPMGDGMAPTEPGTLSITVLSAKDLKPVGSHGAAGTKPYVQLKVGSKTHKSDHLKGVEPEWNETFSFNIAPGTSTFSVTVFDHHSFGKDPELGEAQVEIWRHIQPAVPSADVFVELGNGSGLLKLRLDWTLGVGSKLAKSRSRTPSVSSKNGAADSPSRGKFSLTPKKSGISE